MKQGALPFVSAQRGRPRELTPRLVVATQARQQVAPDRGQVWVLGHRRVVGDRVRDRQAGLRPLREAHRDGPVELDHRRRRHVGEHLVQGRDPFPVGVLGPGRPGVAGCDRGLQSVGPVSPAEGGRPGRARPGRAGSAAGPSVGDPGPAGGSPRPPARSAPRSREACNSISASRPCTSDSSVASPASTRPSRIASSHSAGRVQSSPAVAE